MTVVLKVRHISAAAPAGPRAHVGLPACGGGGASGPWQYVSKKPPHLEEQVLNLLALLVHKYKN